MRRTFILTLTALLIQPAYAQHGVIREYAAFSARAEAVPLAPLFDAPLTDTSITVGPDKAFYLTGSAVDGQGAIFTNRLSFWRSTDLKQWTALRTLDRQRPHRALPFHARFRTGGNPGHRERPRHPPADQSLREFVVVKDNMSQTNVIDGT